MAKWVRVMRLWVWIVVVAALSALMGCGNFFVPPDNGGGGGGGSTTGNRAYVANSANNTLAGFTVGTGTLTAVPSSPVALNYAPVAAIATSTNNFLYVAGQGALYVYTINADGSLSAPSTGAAAIVNVVALDISPDGNWLFGLDGTTSAVDQFQINKSTGGLGGLIQTPYSVLNNAVIAPRAIRVAPNGALVYIALGTGGDIVFTFNTTTGALISSANVSVPATTSDNGLAIDSTTSFLYVARSGTGGGVAVYSIGASGVPTSITGSPFAAGNQPFSIVIDPTGTYLYVANRTDGTISGFTIGMGGALTALTGSPYGSGKQVSSIGIDQSGKYLLAAAFGGSPDLSMYNFDAAVPGKLDLVTSTATGTGTTGAASLALTH
jgi:6-phosphogluconolactonase